MLRVDLRRREIRAAVRDLAFPAGAMPSAAGAFGGLRAELGADVHRRHARRRARESPAFRAEVPLRLVTVIDGFTVRLQGRADGLTDDPTSRPRCIVVEEVKSVDLPAADVARITLDDVPEAALQARLYALMRLRAAGHPAPRVTARVVAVSLLDAAEAARDVPFDAEAVEEELRELVRARIAMARARAKRARERARLAELVLFPYATPRPHQDTLAAAIGEGLAARRPVIAEAPTGVGKTVAALVPALRRALRQDALVFWVTAKRTQRRLVAETFEDVLRASPALRGRVRAMTLKPRERMCPPETLRCHVDHCPLLARLHDVRRREAAVAGLLEGGPHIAADDVFRLGARERLCPHVLSRVLCAHVDVVVGDFNHLFDSTAEPGAFPGSKLPRPVIAVVDEAHNLVDRAREYDAAFVARERVAALAPRAPRPVRTLPLFGIEDAPLERAPRDALGGAAVDVLAALDETVRGALAAGTPSRDGCVDARPDVARWDALAGPCARALVHRLRTTVHVPGARHDDPVVATLSSVLRLRELLRRDEPQLVPYASGSETAPRGRGVGVCCVDPSERLERRHRQLAGTVLLSATLSPLSQYAEALGVAALDPVEVVLPSPFPAGRRCVLAVPSVRTTWRQRSRHVAGIARIIEDVVAVRPGHYVAFFPSHRFLEDVRARLSRIPGDVLVQRPRMPDDERTAVLDRLAGDPDPLLLLAFTGGVFAEGVDLPGEALIGAIVVGPSLPGVGFERDAMRRHHDARGRDGFAHAMLHPGLQRVVQAAGRVHRTAEDRGVIVLVGERFSEDAYATCLPSHWLDPEGRVPITSSPADVLRAFWDGTAALSRGRAPERRAPRTCRTGRAEDGPGTRGRSPV